MRLPYIKINQKGEFFIFTKMKASDLCEKINFKFRNPYPEQSKKDFTNYQEYIRRFGNKNINIESDPNGIQRRLNLDKINDITKTMNLDGEIMPNAVLLTFDFTNQEQEIEFLNKYDDMFHDDFGLFEIDESIKFHAVDGQHRLAGLFCCEEDIKQNIEVPIILLLDVESEMIAKIFGDINGKQTKVNNSVILDLMEYSSSKNELRKNLHDMCKQLNNDIYSPFYHHIKMLGYGFGSISQSFLVIYLSRCVEKIAKPCDQKFYDSIYYYFCAVQKEFKNFWPVPVYDEEVLKKEKKDFNSYVEDYSKKMTRESEGKKSNHNQIMKTNGIGALLKLAPTVFSNVKYDYDDEQELYDSYCNYFKKASSFDWINDHLVSNGTSEKTQSAIKDKLLALMGLEEIK